MSTRLFKRKNKKTPGHVYVVPISRSAALELLVIRRPCSRGCYTSVARVVARAAMTGCNTRGFNELAPRIRDLINRELHHAEYCHFPYMLTGRSGEMEEGLY